MAIPLWDVCFRVGMSQCLLEVHCPSIWPTSTYAPKSWTMCASEDYWPDQIWVAPNEFIVAVAYKLQ